MNRRKLRHFEMYVFFLIHLFSLLLIHNLSKLPLKIHFHGVTLRNIISIFDYIYTLSGMI